MTQIQTVAQARSTTARAPGNQPNLYYVWKKSALALLLAVWFCISTAARAQSATPDLPTYTGWLREAYTAAQRSDRLSLEDAAGRLTSTTSVSLPDAATITVDNRWLGDALTSSAPDLPAISARLGAILDALAQPPNAAPADARERLQQILERPPFTQAEPAQTPSWISAFFDWLLRALENLLRPIGRITPGGGSALAWVIAGIGGLLLLGVIVYLVRGLRRGVISAERAPADPEANLTASTALDQASGLARGGDYRTAVRFLYLSALLRLDERNVLRYDRALTNREYLDRVRDNPDLRAHMTPIVDTFDRVWYGHLPIDADSFAAYQRQVEALRDDKMTR